MYHYDHTPSKKNNKWKKKIRALYEYIQSDNLKSASETVQWLPNICSTQQSYTLGYVVFGTHNIYVNNKNYLMIAKVKMPKDDNTKNEDAENEDPDKENKENVDKNNVKKENLGEVKLMIKHAGEVHRARYMPQSPCIVATSRPFSDIHIYHFTNYEENSKNDDAKPDLRLQGHTNECFGISWSRLASGLLLSASSDSTIHLWDINGMTHQNRCLNPVNVFRGHAEGVEDVAWNPINVNVFCSSGVDGTIKMWDKRRRTTVNSVVAHECEVNSISFNPRLGYYLASASSDSTVGLWDIRKFDKKCYSFSWHNDEVFHVRWSPHHRNVLASASDDRRICIADLDNPSISTPVTSSVNNEDSSELVFTHRCHTHAIHDFSWHPTIPWMICSVANNPVMQFWKIDRKFTDHIFSYTYESTGFQLC